MVFDDIECCANCVWIISPTDEEEILRENSEYKEDDPNRPQAGDCAIGEEHDKNYWCPSFKGNLPFLERKKDKNLLEEKINSLVVELNMYKSGSKEYLEILKRVRILLNNMKECQFIDEELIGNYQDMIDDSFGIKHPTPYFKAIKSEIGNDKYGMRIVCFRTLKDVEGMYIFGNNEELDRLFPAQVYYVSKKDRNKSESILYKKGKEFIKSPHTFLYRLYERNIKLPNEFHKSFISDYGEIRVKNGSIKSEEEEIFNAMKKIDEYVYQNGFDALTTYKVKKKR